MSYLKSNPKALLDAIPTPRGEEEKLLKEFKKGMDMKFNDTSSNMSYRRNSKNMTFGGMNSGLNTPSKRLQSPKVGLGSSRKLNASQTKLNAYGALNFNTSSSRKSISSPKGVSLTAKTFYPPRVLAPPSV
jgi:hypothetical protein